MSTENRRDLHRLMVFLKLTFNLYVDTLLNDNDNDNKKVILTYGSIKRVFNDRFLKIKTFIVMEITLGHKYRWHATTE